MRKSKQELFEEKFIKLGPDDCWIWTAATHERNPYGLFQGERAHRVSYRMYNGKIPSGMIIRHLCNNHSCVNPNHLETGTHKQNSEDMTKAGRQAKGSKQGHAILNEADVAQIKAVLKKHPTKWGVGSKLAKFFKVHTQRISHIKTEKDWVDVEPADEIEIDLDDLI